MLYHHKEIPFDQDTLLFLLDQQEAQESPLDILLREEEEREEEEYMS